MSGPSPSRKTYADQGSSSPIPSIKLIRHSAKDTEEHGRPEVVAEVDELISGDEEQSKTPSGNEVLPCRWGSCLLYFSEQEKLVHHIHTGERVSTLLLRDFQS